VSRVSSLRTDIFASPLPPPLCAIVAGASSTSRFEIVMRIAEDAHARVERSNKLVAGYYIRLACRKYGALSR